MGRHLLTALSVAALAGGLVAGCGSGVTSSGVGAAVATSGHPLRLVPVGVRPAGAPAPALSAWSTSEPLAHYADRSWDTATVDGQTVTLDVLGCAPNQPRPVVVETPTTVRVTVRDPVLPPGTPVVACGEGLEPDTVTLKRPLGSRTLLDGGHPGGRVLVAAAVAPRPTGAPGGLVPWLSPHDPGTTHRVAADGRSVAVSFIGSSCGQSPAAVAAARAAYETYLDESPTAVTIAFRSVGTAATCAGTTYGLQIRRSVPLTRALGTRSLHDLAAEALAAANRSAAAGE